MSDPRTPPSRWNPFSLISVLYGPSPKSRVPSLELEPKSIGATIDLIRRTAEHLNKERQRRIGEADPPDNVPEVAGKTPRPPGLAGKRIEELEKLLSIARSDKELVSRTHPWLKIGGAVTGLILIAIPVGSFLTFGWIGESPWSAVDLVELMSGIATVVALLFAWAFFLYRFDLRRRRDYCLKRLIAFRTFIHIVDSHVLSKDFGPMWEHPMDRNRVAGCKEDDRVYREPALAIQYLNLAAKEVRCCARIAALYSEWLPAESEVAVQTETLLQIGLDIERNTLLKADLIREAALALDTGRASP
jgi:hypothetical protein